MYILFLSAKFVSHIKNKKCKEGEVLKKNQRTNKRKISKKNIRYEPHQKEIKINFESDANSNATTFTLLCK